MKISRRTCKYGGWIDEMDELLFLVVESFFAFAIVLKK